MPMRSIVVGCVPNRNWVSPGGSGSLTLRTAMRFSKSSKAAGSPARSKRERVRPRLDLPREHVGGRAEQERRERDRERDRRQHDRPGLDARIAEPVAAPECLGEPLRQERAGRRHQREPGEPAQQVVVLLMAQLVGDDEPDLVAREIVQQVVVEHDPLAVAEAADVRVGRSRAAARVDPVHLPHVDSGLVRQPQHVLADRSGGQLARSR